MSDNNQLLARGGRPFKQGRVTVIAPGNANVFVALDAPEMDYIFTVCDRAAGGTCPRWPGRPFTGALGY
jgi:hypothetical protein